MDPNLSLSSNLSFGAELTNLGSDEGRNFIRNFLDRLTDGRVFELAQLHELNLDTDAATLRDRLERHQVRRYFGPYAASWNAEWDLASSNGEPNSHAEVMQDSVLPQADNLITLCQEPLEQVNYSSPVHLETNGPNHLTNLIDRPNSRNLAPISLNYLPTGQSFGMYRDPLTFAESGPSYRTEMQINVESPLNLSSRPTVAVSERQLENSAVNVDEPRCAQFNDADRLTTAFARPQAQSTRFISPIPPGFEQRRDEEANAMEMTSHSHFRAIEEVVCSSSVGGYVQTGPIYANSVLRDDTNWEPTMFRPLQPSYPLFPTVTSTITYPPSSVNLMPSQPRPSLTAPINRLPARVSTCYHSHILPEIHPSRNSNFNPILQENYAHNPVSQDNHVHFPARSTISAPPPVLRESYNPRPIPELIRPQALQHPVPCRRNDPVYEPARNPSRQYENASSMRNSRNFSSLDNATFLRETRTCDLLSKWNIAFRGEFKKDPEEFLAKLTTCVETYGLTLDDLIRTLPAVCDAESCQWLRREQSAWRDYADFIEAFRLQYCFDDLQEKLRVAIEMRTQGPGEDISTYLSKIRMLFDKVKPQWRLQDQLDRTHRNLHPKYKFKIKRDDFNSFSELLRLGKREEMRASEERSYRPPPSIDEFPFPNAAYVPLPSRKPRLAALDESEAKSSAFCMPTQSSPIAPIQQEPPKLRDHTPLLISSR